MHSPKNLTSHSDELETHKEFLAAVMRIVEDRIPAHCYDIAGIAAQLGLSEQTFRRRIAACTGKTPKQLVTSLQMREAERLLLKYPDVKIKDIAFQCGFDETSPFSKAFKKWSGLCPEQFRKLKGADNGIL